MKKLYDLLVEWTLHRRKLLWGIIIALTLVFGFFAARIDMKTNFKDLLSTSAPFMLGLAFLEKEDKTTAWWPTIEKEKTFDSSKSEEEVGFGMGRLDRVIWHGEDYEATFAKETETAWEYRVTPRDAAGIDFSYGIIDVNRADDTLVRADFFDADDKAIETDTVTSYQEIATESESTLLYPLSFACDDFANNKTTTMEYSKIEFPESIADLIFTLDFLKGQSATVLKQKD